MTDYQRIAAAISYLQATTTKQPGLDEIAHHIGLSPFHFQRLFKRFAGVSPKRFLQHLTSEHAKILLRSSESILETSFAVGLSSAGRLHDLIVNVDAVTPGEYKSGGKGVNIEYAIHQTPFGECLLAVTKRGICRLEFHDEVDEGTILKLIEAWPNAHITNSPSTTEPYVDQIFDPSPAGSNRPLSLLLKGTNFQLKVWQALLNIPPGCITSYANLAKHIHHPGAGRAVGTALGHNPIAYLIPCHRVLRGDGDIGGYRWGRERKWAILGCEFNRSQSC